MISVYSPNKTPLQVCNFLYLKWLLNWFGCLIRFYCIKTDFICHIASATIFSEHNNHHHWHLRSILMRFSYFSSILKIFFVIFHGRCLIHLLRMISVAKTKWHSKSAQKYKNFQEKPIENFWEMNIKWYYTFLFVLLVLLFVLTVAGIHRLEYFSCVYILYCHVSLELYFYLWRTENK